MAVIIEAQESSNHSNAGYRAVMVQLRQPG